MSTAFSDVVGEIERRALDGMRAGPPCEQDGSTLLAGLLVSVQATKAAKHLCGRACVSVRACMRV